jgi:hypothetical protein
MVNVSPATEWVQQKAYLQVKQPVLALGTLALVLLTTFSDDMARKVTVGRPGVYDRAWRRRYSANLYISAQAERHYW